MYTAFKVDNTSFIFVFTNAVMCSQNILKSDKIEPNYFELTTYNNLNNLSRLRRLLFIIENIQLFIA